MLPLELRQLVTWLLAKLPVDHPALVGGVEGAADLPRDVRGPGGIEGAVLGFVAGVARAPERASASGQSPALDSS